MDSAPHDIRRQRLVQSAKQIFAAQGYYATNISEIVRHAGIARSTFYLYFDGKLHLFQSILDSFIQDLHSSIEKISISPGAPDPVVQIHANLTRVLDLVLREKDLTRILIRHGGALDHTIDSRLEDFYKEAAGLIEQSLKLGIAMKIVKPCDTRLTSYSIIGAVKEVVFQLTSSQQPQPSVAEVVNGLLDFGMGGILVRPRTPWFETSAREGQAPVVPSQSGATP